MIELLKRLLLWTLRPVWRPLLRWAAAGDPWQRLTIRPPVRRYGLGAVHEFDWYFEGPSTVEVKSLDEVKAWLLECSYEHDPVLFRQDDVWQHPTEFERLRSGDCEDHALWAWRKLVELGYDAELVCGRLLPWDPADANQRGHVWLLVHETGRAFVFETVAKKADAMTIDLAEATTRYRPEFGVDRRRERFTFNGALLTLCDEQFGLTRT